MRPCQPLLIGLTLLFGVVAELTLLPLLILYFYRHKPKAILEQYLSFLLLEQLC